ncbi:unnamed protein product [Clavelina lepadiformis]|uniref:Uncharacterized protein n=1 Tax=Clavelina lepadiformis TaxID=159417 RepID=A0ABP0GRM1_CLALP
MRLENFLESKRPGRAHSFHLARIFRTRESITRESKRSSCERCPAGARFGGHGSGHAPSQTPNPAASSRDPEAVLGYHGDAGFCDYYEGAGSRVSECARECESKQNRSRLASGTMGRCNAVRRGRPCLAGVLSGLSDPVASYRRASARVLHSNRRQRPELTVFGARASRERSV